jgi:hypothetical protein
MTFLPLLLKFWGLIGSQTYCNWALEASNTFRHALAKNLTKLLNKYDLREKFIVYVKDERFNLNIMITTLKSIISYDILSLIENFQGSCFGHAFFKACQYASLDEKVCKGSKYVFVKTA